MHSVHNLLWSHLELISYSKHQLVQQTIKMLSLQLDQDAFVQVLLRKEAYLIRLVQLFKNMEKVGV